MTDQETKLNKLKELLKMLDESITRKEFTESFANVVSQIRKVEKTLADRTNNTLNDLKASFSELEAKVGEYSTKEISGAINSLQARVEKSMKEEANLMNFIRDKVAKIKEGHDGKPGKDGKDGIPADEQKIIKEVLAKIEIPDLKELEDKIKNLETKPSMQIFGGNRPLTVQGAGVTKDKVTRVINFTGATVSRSTDGVVTVAIAGGGGVETPIGAMNSANKDFTVLNTPKFVTWQGQTLYEGAGYSLAGLTITLDTAPDSGDVLRSHY